MLTGRQVAWMLYDYFRTDDHMSLMYSYNELNAMKWHGDDRMEEYLIEWDFIIDHMEERITDNCKRDVMAGHVQNSEALKEDYAHFKRVGRTHSDHSAAYLRKAIERHIMNTRQIKNVQLRKNALAQGFRPLAEPGGAAPQPPKPSKPTRKEKEEDKRARKEQRERESGNPGTDKEPCWHHNAKVHVGGQGCRYGDKCRCDHSLIVPKKTFDAMKKPAYEGKGDGPGRGQPPKGGGKGKGNPSAIDKTKPLPVYACKDFLKDGACPKSPCCWPHLTQAEYDERKAQAKAVAQYFRDINDNKTPTKGGGKGKRKGRGKGTWGGPGAVAIELGDLYE